MKRNDSKGIQLPCSNKNLLKAVRTMTARLFYFEPRLEIITNSRVPQIYIIIKTMVYYNNDSIRFKVWKAITYCHI